MFFFWFRRKLAIKPSGTQRIGQRACACTEHQSTTRRLPKYQERRLMSQRHPGWLWIAACICAQRTQGACLDFIPLHVRPVRCSLSTGCICSPITSTSDRPTRQAKNAASVQSLIRPRPCVAQSWGTRRTKREHSTCVSASEREPPWAMTFDLRERETEWTQENKVSCLTNADKCCSEAGCRHLQANFSKLVMFAFIA
jgi:hypothetical protein